MIPGKLCRVEERPEQVGESVLAVLSLGSGEAALEVSAFLRRGSPGKDRQVGHFDGLAVVGSQLCYPARGVEQIVGGFVLHYLAVHHQQALGDRAARDGKLVLAGVTVTADEVVAARVGGESDVPGRLRTEGRKRGSLKD